MLGVEIGVELIHVQHSLLLSAGELLTDSKTTPCAVDRHRTTLSRINTVCFCLLCMHFWCAAGGMKLILGDGTSSQRWIYD